MILPVALRGSGMYGRVIVPAVANREAEAKFDGVQNFLYPLHFLATPHLIGT